MNDGARNFNIEASIAWGNDAGALPADPYAEIRRLLASGAVDEADKMCAQLAESAAPEAETQHLKAQIEMHRRDWAAAIEWLHRTTATDETRTSAWIDLGRCSSQIGKWADATMAFQRAAEMDPDSGEVYLECGICLGKQGKLQEAISQLQRSAGADNTTPDAYIQMAE